MKTTTNFAIKKLSKALAPVLFIGLYWAMTGGVAKHIFIYQTQSWRVEWLIWTFAVPVYFTILIEIVRRIRLTKHVRLYDLFYVFWGFLLFLPNYEIFLPVFLWACYLFKNRVINFEFVKIVFGGFSLYVLILQTWMDLEFTQGLNILLGAMKYDILCDNISFLVTVEFLMFLFVVGCLIKRNGFDFRNVVSLLLLLFFFYSPKLLGIPVVVAAMFVSLPVKRNLLISLSVFVLLLDFFTMNGIRPIGCFYSIVQIVKTKDYFFLLCSFVLAMLYMHEHKGLFSRKFVMGVVCLGSVFLGCCVIMNYDKRSSDRVLIEKGIDPFFEKDIFPQVKQREKMLFFVSGEMANSSRVQFLTGSYFDYSTHNGEIFFEKQFLEARRRDNLLFHKADLSKTSHKSAFDKFVKEKMSNPDSLLDRTVFLCGAGEISHLVTDFSNFPLKQQDSVVLYNKQTVFLYGCP